MALYIPVSTGVKALDELPNVPWHSLKHAYSGASVRNPFTGVYNRYPDIDALLGLVADDEARDDALSDLAGYLYHQGDLYEATAYAVPFLCALAADPPGDTERELLGLLANIGEATVYEKNAAVATLIVEAFRSSRAHIDSVVARQGLPKTRRYLSDFAYGCVTGEFDPSELDGP